MDLCLALQARRADYKTTAQVAALTRSKPVLYMFASLYRSIACVLVNNARVLYLTQLVRPTSNIRYYVYVVRNMDPKKVSL